MSIRRGAEQRRIIGLLTATPLVGVAVLTSRDLDTRELKADDPLARLGLVDGDTRLALLDRTHER